MNIYLREMKSYRKSFLFWCLGLLVMIGGGMGKYAGFKASGQSAAELFGSLPKVFLSLFGIEGVNINTANGFYSIIGLFVFIMAGIHAANLGASVISKEERDKTSEFLFVKPVSRVKIVTSKILAAFTYVVLFNIVSLLVSIAFASKIAAGDTGLVRDMLVISGTMLIKQTIFLFMGTCFASILKKSETSSGIVTGVFLSMYMISVIVDINPNLDFLKVITPFKYFEGKSLINGGSMESIYVLISAVLIAAFIGVTYTMFPKRDLNI